MPEGHTTIRGEEVPGITVTESSRPGEAEELSSAALPTGPLLSHFELAVGLLHRPANVSADISQIN